MSSTRGYYSADDMVSYIDRTLGDEPSQDDVDTVLRVLPKLVNDWRNLSPQDLERVTEEPRLSVHHEYNALLEGLVAYFFHVTRGERAPHWTTRTRLDRQWVVRRDQVERGGERLFMKIWQSTPIEFLERGLLFSRSELKLI